MSYHEEVPHTSQCVRACSCVCVRAPSFVYVTPHSRQRVSVAIEAMRYIFQVQVKYRNEHETMRTSVRALSGSALCTEVDSLVNTCTHTHTYTHYETCMLHWDSTTTTPETPHRFNTRPILVYCGCLSDWYIFCAHVFECAYMCYKNNVQIVAFYTALCVCVSVGTQLLCLRESLPLCDAVCVLALPARALHGELKCLSMVFIL